MTRLLSTILCALLSISSISYAAPDKEAQDIITKAQLGDMDAQLMLGDLYAFAEKGIEKNYEQALNWYEKAAVQGSAVAKYNIGSILVVSNKASNSALAKEWFTQACNDGIEDSCDAALSISEE